MDRMNLEAARVEILFRDGRRERYADCASCLLPVGTMASVTSHAGMQYILYEEPEYRGKSWFIDGTVTPETPADFIPLQCIRSIAGMKSTPAVSPRQRDAEAVREACAGWWAQDAVLRDRRLSWWRQARFGCFIHWGVYALAGGVYRGRTCGYAEHLERALAIPLAEYRRNFIDPFCPDRFDAKEWVRLAKEAGMSYFVITAKHHDGFAMYPSDAYPYDIRMTRFAGRDPMAELKDACDRQGLKFGFYYSHAYDWEHPDAPGNDWDYENPGGTRGLFEVNGRPWYDSHPEMLERVARRYVDGKAIPQIVELLQNYQPDILWFDTPHKLPLSENLRILKTIRQTSPDVVVNGRLARGSDFPTFGDYVNTADRPAELYPTAGDWEAIPTTNESYGYNNADRSHKPASHFIDLLGKAVSRGGNLLMNLGPMGDGQYDPADVTILKGIGDWFRGNGSAIRGCSRSPLPKQYWGEITRNGNVLYLHVTRMPEDGVIILSGLLNPVQRAVVLTDPECRPLNMVRRNFYDTALFVPEALRCDRTVIAVTVSGEMLTGGGRLLPERETDCLQAFDADVISAGLTHGDGKTNRSYIDGFRRTDQQLVWHIRALRKTDYLVRIRYTRLHEADGGVFGIACGQHVAECTVSGNGTGEKTILTDELYLTVEAGCSDLVLYPVSVVGAFIRILDLTLIPQRSGAVQDSDTGGVSWEIDLGGESKTI